MEDSNTYPAMNSSPITNCPSPTARRSGGPRTAEGKRRSCQNAHKHGLYTDESFLEGAALELGEDPRQFQRLLKGLIEARRPVGALELAVIEDIALLLLKKGRVDKAELAVQVSNLHQHDFDRRKKMIQVGHNNSEASEWDVREHGLRRAIGSPGQYEQVLTLLGGLLGMVDFNEFDRMKEAMRTLYGTEHTLRGAEMDTLRAQLCRTKPEDESFQPLKKALLRLVAAEGGAVEREYEIFLQEHVTNTRSARVAATAPSHAQWAAIIRQQNSLNRQLEHKIRLLMELQRERKSEAQLLESLETSSPPDPGDPQDGGQPASSKLENRNSKIVSPDFRLNTQTVSAPAAVHPSTAEQDGVLHEERAISPIAVFTRQAARLPAALFICLRAVLAVIFKNMKNRGNELKDLLQRQGITVIMALKRTHFRAEEAALAEATAGLRRNWLEWQDNRLDLRDFGRPSAGVRIGGSPDPRLLQALMQPAVLAFPIVRPDHKRLAGGDPFDGQGCEFVFRVLFRAQKALDILFDSNSLGLSAPADSGFELWRNGDGHGSSAC